MQAVLACVLYLQEMIPYGSDNARFICYIIFITFLLSHDLIWFFKCFDSFLIICCSQQ